MRLKNICRPRAFLLAGAAMIASTAARAEDPAAEAIDGEDIVVTGSIIEAQAASVREKRDAPNLVDVAAADAVGRFPDQNSAAALSRLPSVAVQRDQGQERYIQVRGAPNRWTSVSIDGIPMVGVDEGGTTRAFRFDAVPAVLLSSMAINKSLTPDLPSEAIVANIDLRTYSPLAQDGFHLQGDLGYGFMQLGGGDQRQASLRASWSNGTVGVVFGGSHYRRKQLTDNREVGLYDAKGPTEFDVRQYQVERENNGLFAAIEFAPRDEFRFFARSIYTEFNDDEQRNQYEFRLDRAMNGTRSLAGGDLVGVPVRGSFNYGEYRTRNYINTIGGEYDGNDGWSAALNLNYTRTENTTYLPMIQSSTPSAAAPSLTYDNSDPRFPTVSLYSTIGSGPTAVRGAALSAFDQSTVRSGTMLIPLEQDTTTDSFTAKADVAREFGDFKLSGGALFANRRINGFTFSQNNVVVFGSGAGAGVTFDPTKYLTNKVWDTRFPLGVTFNYMDNAAMRSDIDDLLTSLEGQGKLNPDANVPAENRYRLTEDTFAAYMMGTYDFGTGQVVAGVRMEHFSLANTGFARTGGTLIPLRSPQSYTDFFPSVNARFDVTDEIVLRLAGQRGIARPSFGEVRVGSSINDTSSPGTIGGGNPELLPEYTWGLDASGEYYIPGGGILAVAGFYRWVDNVLFQFQEPVGSDFYNSNGVDRSAYIFSSTFNGSNGRLYGIEFNYQQQFAFLPGALDGLGFQGNLALLGGKFDTADQKGVPFPGMSDTIVNASLYYEKFGISARVSYQWRSDWLDTLGGLGSGEYRKGYDNLDVSLRYAIDDRFTVFADLSNLTNAVYMAYEGDASRPTEVEQIGSRYMFGIRFAL